MKRMTCAQLGGPCDLAHEGETADEVIKKQDEHLKAMVASGTRTPKRSLLRCTRSDSAARAHRQPRSPYAVAPSRRPRERAVCGRSSLAA